MERKKLSKDELLSRFPYLAQTFNESESSDKRVRLNDVVLINGQNSGFPDPFMSVNVQTDYTLVDSVEVDFCDRTGKVLKELKQGHSRTFPSDTLLSPDASRGDKTDEILTAPGEKPSFVLVKRIKEETTYYSIRHTSATYNVEVYQL